MDDLRKTQLWLGGMHVSFVKWTPNALIYARPGSNDTLGHLSRALVQRLLHEGTLVINGERPDWAQTNFEDEPAN
jgi:hypothetical protein